MGGFFREKFAVSILSSVTLLSNSERGSPGNSVPLWCVLRARRLTAEMSPLPSLHSMAFLCQVAMPSGQHADPNNSGAQSSSSPQGRCWRKIVQISELDYIVWGVGEAVFHCPLLSPLIQSTTKYNYWSFHSWKTFQNRHRGQRVSIHLPVETCVQRCREQGTKLQKSPHCPTLCFNSASCSESLQHTLQTTFWTHHTLDVSRFLEQSQTAIQGCHLHYI